MTSPRWIAALVVVAGCSSIPGPIDPATVTPVEAPLELALGVQAVAPRLADGEAHKDYAAAEVVERGALAGELGRWAAASGAFAAVHVHEAEAPADARAAAWAAGDDLLCEVAVRDLRIRFDGHNGWWLPNVALYATWVFPAWLVATEEYALELTADVALRAGPRRVHEARLEVEVAGAFDELDRGLQLLGPIDPDHDGDVWRRVGRRLWPAARSRLGQALAAELARFHAAYRADAAVRAAAGETLALAVGVGHHHDSSLAPRPWAARDAAAFGAALEAAGARHVRVLADERADAAAVREALRELTARLDPPDQLAVYVSAAVAPGAGGEPGLRLHAGALGVAELAEALAAAPGRKLVVLDGALDGPWDADAAVLAPLAEAGATVLLASRPGDAFLAPDHLGASLFGHHVVRGLQGAADADADDAITAGELAAFAFRWTTAEAALVGARQRPLAHADHGAFAVAAPPPAAAEAAGGDDPHDP